MGLISLHHKDDIEALLRRRSTFLHLYAIGDLDDFFWRHTTWYGLERGEAPPVLLYAGGETPVVLALADEPLLTSARELLRIVAPLLPRRFYAHVSEGLTDVLADEYQIVSHGVHLKMGLTRPELSEAIDTSEVRRLGAADVGDMEALYRVSYPGNWFDRRMVATDHYYGVRRGGELISVAGVHVYSPAYRVAALGNITTHPDWRGRGLGAGVTAALCRELLRTVDHVGLNVKAGNEAAIKCYTRLGFEPVATYQECSFGAKD